MDQYFAAKPAEDLIKALEDKGTKSREHGKAAGLEEKRALSFNYYYGKHFKVAEGYTDRAIKSAGSKGQLKLLAVNHYRNLIRHILVMTTSQRLSYDARAINSDVKSIQQARLGNNLLDVYMREKRLGRELKEAAELSLVDSKAYVSVEWEPAAGKPYANQEVQDADGNPVSKVIYEGDVRVATLFQDDVLFDAGLDTFRKADWVCTYEYLNKWELAAQYPALAEKLIAIKSEPGMRRRFLEIQAFEDSDLIRVAKFIHKRSAALPNGRMVKFCDKDTVMYDGPTPYDRLNVFPIQPGKVLGTCEGYTDGFDLLSIQEALDTLCSTVFTNQAAHGVQKVIVPHNANLTYEQLSEGLALLKFDPAAGKPEALQLTATPAEIFKFMELLERFAETLSGVNSVARGNPDSQLKSGVALGLVQSMALQFASGFQESWGELNEDVATFVLILLRDFAKTDRVEAMAGKMNHSAMLEFSGKDLSQINRVVVDLGNPMSRTIGGRVQIADKLIDSGKIQTPQQYLTLIGSGTMEPLTEGMESQLALIGRENENLLDGKPVRAMVGDAHLLHAQEHRKVTDDPFLRQKAAEGDQMANQILQQATQHLMEHMTQYQTQAPFWSQIAGEPPAPQPMMPPPPGPEQEGAPGPAAGPPGAAPTEPPALAPVPPGPAGPPQPQPGGGGLPLGA